MRLEFLIYRYNPDVDDAPRVQDCILEAEEGYDVILLNAFIQLRKKDPSPSSRRSCHEGVCGSDGLNVNGKNGPACTTPISALNRPGKKIMTHSMPGLSVIRDLVVDIGQFYAQYEKIKPYLLNSGQNPSARGCLQISEQRGKLDGLYECTLYACCSTPYPSFWRNPDKFIGPAGLLAAYCFLIDSRDTETNSCLGGLGDVFSVFRRHSIMNCVSACPRGLDPARAIGHIKSMLLQCSA